MKARTAVIANRTAHKAALTDWTELQEGDPVEIIKNAQTIEKGLTEEVSLSGNVLWLKAEGVETRRLYAKSDGVLIRRA